jgi:hypothetical protein
VLTWIKAPPSGPVERWTVWEVGAGAHIVERTMTDRSQKTPQGSRRNSRRKAQPKASPQDKQHVDDLLDEALDETFPASDPPAMLEPAPNRSDGAGSERT